MLDRKSNSESCPISTPVAALVCLLIGLVVLATGCRSFQKSGSVGKGGNLEVPNPLLVPMMERNYIMDEVSDELDDYFGIYKEERIRIVDSLMTEGWIETHPKIGGTIFEPWKHDSTRGFERLHSTLQTIRRFAKVRVIPTGNSYQIDVKVFKELEDLPQPVGAAVGGPLLRYDDALDVDDDETLPQATPGWIPLGRDFSLEQKILRNIQARLAQGVD